MSDGHSDPDLLDLDDLPDTSTLVGMDPALAGLTKGVRGLARWAKRAHADRRELRAMGRSLLLAVVGGALGMVVTVIGAAVYVGARMERVEALASRVERLEERQWDGRDTSHTSGRRPDRHEEE